MNHPGMLRAGVAIIAILSAGTAMAGSFGLREQSAYSQGASFAGAAAPGDSISAMFWNPSAVTTATGLQTESHFTFILPRSELEVDPSKTLGGGLPGYGNGGDVGIDAFLPASYVAYQVNDSLYLGLSVNSPFGLATHSETPWVGQADHLRAKVFSTAVTPTIGYKVNDMLSVGLGVSVQYFKVDLSRTLLPTSLAVVDLTGDDWGFGLTAGATFTPFEGTEIGLGFRSMITHNLDGDLESPFGTAGITADVHLPETVTLGVRQRINDQFTLLGGIEWTNWSRLGTVPVVNDAGATATNLEFEYKDGWFFSLGGEYAWNDQLTLRAGAAYEIAPTRDEFRSMRLPDADRVWLSAGASYDFNDRLSFDAAYTHLFVDDAPIDVKLPSGLPYYGGTAKGDVDIFSVSLRYKLGG